ncbi:right-handed parallel beta-helix repeat-containing protein [Alkalibacter sp. M17DMB]|nr:right-handed parallel beta-helix repeat-containing protein [Alkalibacter mobilis]
MKKQNKNVESSIEAEKTDEEIASVDSEDKTKEVKNTNTSAAKKETTASTEGTKTTTTSNSITTSRDNTSVANTTTTAPTTETTTTKTETTTTTAPKTEPATEPVKAEEPVQETKPATVAGAFFVSKSGNDANPGTEAAPWKTIQKAASTLKAGQTVYVKEGTYNERVVLKNSGTSGNYITFTNYPGDKVVIDGSGIDWGYSWGTLFNVNSRHYIKINGFRVVNSRWGGIGSQPDSNGSQYVTVTNCSTYNTKASGIAFYHAGNITIDGNSVEKACTASGSQEAISISNVATFTIRNNKVFNITNSVQGAGGEAIDAKNGSSNGKIYNNTVHDIAKIGIYVDAYTKNSSNIEIYGNNVYNCGLGIAIASEKGGVLKNVNVYSNTLKNNKVAYTVAGWNYSYVSPMDNIKFNKNTVSGGNIRLNNPDATNVYVTNNKISGGTIVMDGGLMSETTIDGNTYGTAFGVALMGTNYTIAN